MDNEEVMTNSRILAGIALAVVIGLAVTLAFYTIDQRKDIEAESSALAAAVDITDAPAEAEPTLLPVYLVNKGGRLTRWDVRLAVFKEADTVVDAFALSRVGAPSLGGEVIPVQDLDRFPPRSRGWCTTSFRPLENLERGLAALDSWVAVDAVPVLIWNGPGDSIWLATGSSPDSRACMVNPADYGFNSEASTYRVGDTTTVRELLLGRSR